MIGKEVGEHFRIMELNSLLQLFLDARIVKHKGWMNSFDESFACAFGVSNRASLHSLLSEISNILQRIQNVFFFVKKGLSSEPLEIIAKIPPCVEAIIFSIESEFFNFFKIFRAQERIYSLDSIIFDGVDVFCSDDRNRLIDKRKENIFADKFFVSFVVFVDKDCYV